LTQAYLERCEPWTGENADKPADRILMLEVGRQTKIYRGSIEMSRRGFGEQAAMLNRALFESMAIGRWICQCETDAKRRFDRAYRWDQHLNGERVNNTGWLEKGEEIKSELTTGEIAALRAEFGKYGERMWTGHGNIRDLLDEIRGQFNEAEWRLICNYLRTGHQESTQLLHSTATGLGKTFVGAPEGFGVWTGPSMEMVGRALFSAFVIYQQTLTMIVERYSLADPNGLDDQVTQATFVFKQLPRGVKEPGRNEPCFCGSGMKYKKCHGD
jgi:hypothetical protein